MNGMERQKHNKAGESGFYHFYAVVEDRKDPMNYGRVRVRIFSDHTEDLSALPTDSLPWAIVILPVTSTPNTQHNLWDGSLVFGYYADGIEKQVPVIVGQVAKNGETTIDPEGKKTVGFQDQRESKECVVCDKSGGHASIGINTSPVANPANYATSKQKNIKDKTKLKVAGYNEPASTYASEYPFNKSEETESGHLIEKDDTPGNERICITHRSGSYTEMLKDGSVIHKAVTDSHDLSNNNKTEVVGNTYNKLVGSGYRLLISNGNVTITTSGNINCTAGGDINYTAGGNINMSATEINLN